MMIFYYWFNDENGKEHRVPRDSFCGDIGDTISYMGKIYTITDWVVEENDRG